jgi:hypothetical protein
VTRLDPSSIPLVGVGAANDLCEPHLIEHVHRCCLMGLLDYLTIYVYRNYTPDFLAQVRSQLPTSLRYVWHASDDFELPLKRDTSVRDRVRVASVQALWSPVWATEDVVLTTFGGTVAAGNPNYVPVVLTDDCLEVCVARMRQIQRDVDIPFVPEVPHFFMPVPETMDVATFFTRLAYEADCYLNLDVGHLFSYNLLTGRDLFDSFETFPLDRVVEINCAGGMVGDPDALTWIDDYRGPINPLSVEALEWVIPRCTNLRGIYTESIGCEEWVLRNNLETVNRLFWSLAPEARTTRVLA